MRALEEKAQLSRRLAERSRRRGLSRLAQRYAEAVQSAELGSSSIRHLLLNGTADPVTTDRQEQPGERAEWDAQVSGAERQ